MFEKFPACALLPKSLKKHYSEASIYKLIKFNIGIFFHESLFFPSSLQERSMTLKIAISSSFPLTDQPAIYKPASKQQKGSARK